MHSGFAREASSTESPYFRGPHAACSYGEFQGGLGGPRSIYLAVRYLFFLSDIKEAETDIEEAETDIEETVMVKTPPPSQRSRVS